MIKVINFHITMACNYHCRFCFAQNYKESELDFKDACRICDKIKDHFAEQGIADGRVNFAGGEPLLCKHIFELLDYCKAIGLSTSIITNGSLLTEQSIAWLGRSGVEMIGISVDSLDADTNIQSGRCTNRQKTLTADRLIQIGKAIKREGMRLKINCCVSRFNHRDDLSPFLSEVQPDRFKILRAYKLEGVNDSESIFVTDEQFAKFCERHKVHSPVLEDACDIECSYAIIYPDGQLLNNGGGQLIQVGKVLETSISNLFATMQFNQEGYDKRYSTA